MEEMKKEYDLKNKRMRSISDKLGEKMLSGWSMLGTVCPLPACQGTPLMKPSASDTGSMGSITMLCVSCDQEFVESELDGKIVAVGTSSAATSKGDSIARSSVSDATVITSSRGSSNEPDASFYLNMHNAPDLNEPMDTKSTSNGTTTGSSSSSRDMITTGVAAATDINSDPDRLSRFATTPSDPSVLISRRLLQGWALLDRSCPKKNCPGGVDAVPLVRDLQGVEHCVQCENVAVPPTANAGKASKLPVIASGKVDPTIRSRVEFGSDDEDEDEEEGEELDMLRSSRMKSNITVPVASTGNSQQSVKSNHLQGRRTGHNKQHRSVETTTNNDVLYILNEKLRDAAEKLEHCTSADNSIKLAELIEKLANAIKAVCDLP